MPDIVLKKAHYLACLIVMSITLTSCGSGDTGSDSLTDPSLAAASSAAGITEQDKDAETGTNSAQETNNVELALTSGHASLISDSADLEQALLDTIDSGATYHSDAINQLFNLNEDGTARTDGSSLTNIDWNPSHDAALLGITFGSTVSLLETNAVSEPDYDVSRHSLAALGESNARYMVMGGNPMRNYRRDAPTLNEEMHQFLENSIAWLSQRNDLKTAPFSVVIAQMSDSYYFPDAPAVREWLDTRFPDQVSYNKARTCDDQHLSSCITLGTNLLIVSQHQESDTDVGYVTDAIKSAMAMGVPVLYLHHDGGLTALGNALLPIFDITYRGDNYWRKLSLANFDITDYANALPTEIQSVRNMIQHFHADDYYFDWSACEGEDCSAVTNLQAEFQEAADYVREMMTTLDSEKVDLFASDKYRLKKLLALLGDLYRQTVQFPMDKNSTADSALLKSLYADHAVYQFRAINPAQPDMGTFSRSDFSSITPSSKNIQLISKRNFRSAGAYALPGQTVAVTRNDNSDMNVEIFVNTVRSGSTHQWADNGYSRPKYLKGEPMPISPGETFQFTSPYGGPIQFSFDTNDLAVDITLENIGEHPYWRSNADDVSFAAKLQANEYDWSELASPSFEVHSKTDKLQESMVNPVLGGDSGIAQALAASTMSYVHNYPHLLAGFKGPGIDEVDEIHQFAAERNLTISDLDLVKHMNADQATCGYGCSGNPYDAYWSFSPVGHGDIHELGHGLEKFRLRFNDWPTHAMTNMYSYYTKTQYHKNTGRDPECQKLPFESNWAILQDSLTSDNPAAHIQANLWDVMGWSEGAAMFIQMMMSAEDNGALKDGWHLLARLHTLERGFAAAIKNEETWLAVRDNVGFSTLTLAQAKALTQNDWLLVAVSLSTHFDHREYFSLWGHHFSSEADAQVAAMTLPSMPLNYYISSATGYCEGQGFDGNKLPLDGGVYPWPGN